MSSLVGQEVKVLSEVSFLLLVIIIIIGLNAMD